MSFIIIKKNHAEFIVEHAFKLYGCKYVSTSEKEKWINFIINNGSLDEMLKEIKKIKSLESSDVLKLENGSGKKSDSFEVSIKLKQFSILAIKNIKNKLNK